MEHEHFSNVFYMFSCEFQILIIYIFLDILHSYSKILFHFYICILKLLTHRSLH